MRPHVTGSSVDRFLQCQHWAHPSIALPKSVANDAMREGTRRHKIAEHILRGGSHFPEPRDLHIANAAEGLRANASVLQVEQGYAYDPVTRTARLIAGRTEEGYQGAQAHEIPATIDAVYRDPNGVLVVRDWKLGASGIQYVPSPERAGQLLLGLLAVRASGAFACDVLAVEFADDQEVSRAPVTHSLLDEFAERLRDAWKAMHASGIPAPVTGPGCKWCPLIDTCSAHYSLVQRSSASITAQRRLPMAIKTQQDAQDFVYLVDDIEDYLARMKEQLKVFARSNVVIKGNQQYREALESRMQTTDLGNFHTTEDLPALCAAQGLNIDDVELRIVAKYKGEPKPVFRLRRL